MAEGAFCFPVWARHCFLHPLPPPTHTLELTSFVMNEVEFGTVVGPLMLYTPNTVLF